MNPVCRLAVVPLSLVASGCGVSAWVEDADAEVASVLEPTTRVMEAERRATLIEPEPLPEEAPPEEEPAEEELSEEEVPHQESEDEAAGVAAADAVPQEAVYVVDLEEALRIAVASNRGFKGRRESLYQAGLSHTLTRFNFGPQINGQVSAGYGVDESRSRSTSISSRLGVSQILPTGGTVGVDGSLSRTLGDAGIGFGAEQSYGSAVGVNLTQPLLRGFGYDISHEALTQAERSLVYSVRDFELFRQDFSIDTAQRFFNLVSQKKTLVNEEANFEQAVFDRQKAEALLQVDRIKEQDLFRARTREIDAEDALIDARARFERAIEEFKIYLGLPDSAVIELVDEEPPFDPVRIDVESAVRAARNNRLDLLTEREQLEDVRRGVRIAENSLLPDVSLSVGANFIGGDDRLRGASPDDWDLSAGISMEIPLQRKPERNSYRNALIGLEQAERAFQLRLENLDLDVRDQLRQLRSVEKRIILQHEQIEQQEKAVAINTIRYEAGELENRDLLDARQSLVNARNALINLKADHFIQSLRLLRNLGLLFVDDDGMWR